MKRGTGDQIFTHTSPCSHACGPRMTEGETRPPPCSWSVQRAEGHATRASLRGRTSFVVLCERERERERREGGRTNREGRNDGGLLFSPSPSPDIYSSNDAPKRPLDSKLIKCLAGSQTAIYFSKDASIISKEKPGYIFNTREQRLLNLFRLMSAYEFGEC